MRPPALRAAVVLMATALLAGCSSHRQARSPGESPAGHAVEGIASWYGPGFDGRRTANGEIYDSHDLTCAHRTFPFGTRLLVRNLSNGRTCWVRVNDRGPYIAPRIVDLSYSAAEALGIVGPGTARVRLTPGQPPEPGDPVPLPPASIALPPMVSESLVAPAALPAPAEDPALDSAPALRLPWSVQVGAFSVAVNAEHLVRDLAGRGISARVVSEDGLSKVRVGSFADPDVALDLAESLRRQGLGAIPVVETTVISAAGSRP